MTAPHELDALVEELLPTAMRLAIVVHDRDQEGAAEVLAPLAEAGDWTRVMALCVALAAMTPVDVPATDLLAWSFGPHVTPEQYAQILRIIPEGMKRCTSCREVLPLRVFHRDATKPDGRKARCQYCISETRLASLGRGEGAA
ncbi:hypothetical protein [Actinomadura decatromicini]|uniref:Uncharacterized protein n=1 Tax=Actinomadura decatromicini TaxID=2604572 RepID=A0A5D3FBE2_9ACTN|nr:hypothetical protein [Actinomadura decatromicini]TYK45204.1 hypothetical protein FXF68_31495 [Actinomadura decatromicini]